MSTLVAKTIYGKQWLGGNSGVLVDGNAVTVLMAGCRLPCTVWVEPAGGDTVTVTYKVSADATAQNWPAGATAVYAEWRLEGPVYSISFQRTAGAGTTSKYGVTQ